MQAEKNHRSQRLKGQTLPFLLLVFGLLLSAAATLQIQRLIEREQLAQLEAQVIQFRNELVLHAYRHVDVLQTYKSQFATHHNLSDDAFLRTTIALDLGQRLPGIDTVGYVRGGGPEGQDVSSFSGRYIHMQGDLRTQEIRFPTRDPIRMAALRRAVDSGRAAASAPSESIVHPGKYHIVMVYLPIYHGVVVPATSGERRAQLEGAVFVALHADRLVESLLPQVLVPNAQVRLIFEGYDFDAAPHVDEFLLYDDHIGLNQSAQLNWVDSRISLGGTSWRMELGFPPSASADRWLPVSVFVGGVLISALGALSIGMLLHSRRLSVQRASQDRSKRREAEAALHLRQRAIEASANAVVIASATKQGYPVEYVNPAFERMTGYTAQEVIGQSLRNMHGNDVGQEGLAELQSILREQREGQTTLRNYRKNGELYWTRVHLAPVRDDNGDVTHFVAAKYDVTQTRRYQETLEFQAWHDALTLLPNRHALRARLSEAILRGGPDTTPFWVVFLDLDNFKLMNDTLGHSVGDHALQEIARRIQEAVQGDDMVARRGGDEFVFILFDDTPPRNARTTVERIMTAVSRPLNLETHRFFPTCSIGIAIHPQDGDTPETLIKHADIAMYHAKRQGKNNYQFFSAQLQRHALRRVELEQDLRAALTNKEFELHYQPQLTLPDGGVSSMEALVRWRHPERGLVSPGDFIPIAEETGLIVPLGEWILRTACKQVAQWNAAGLGPLRVAVNISARQFNDDHLSSMVHCVLVDYQLDPTCLELELTETLLADDVENAKTILHRLKALGVVLSLDDFGTGYSSLAQLRRFPIDILKVDRSFISDIATDPSGDAVVRTIVKLAHNLGLQALAEGVETQAQKDFLESVGCDGIQGYLVSRPMPAEAFEAWLRDHAR